MAHVLPSIVEEINMQHHNLRISTLNVDIMLKKATFDDIPTAKSFKREVSLPNGVENWNISNFDSYLNFDDVIGNDFSVCSSPNDRVVPEGDPRGRCASISSVSSFGEETQKPMFHNFGVKTFNTIHMDSGSTCISSDHSYFSTNTTIQNSHLDPEETYQNLDMFLQEVPEMKPVDTLPSPFSPLPSSSSDDIFELTVLDSAPKSFSSEDSICSASGSSKRTFDSLLDDDVFSPKHTKLEFTETLTTSDNRYHDNRKKNNIASKNCRKTRKEKQKDMEQKVVDLEEEIEQRRVQVRVLEQLIQAHKQCLLNVIAQKH